MTLVSIPVGAGEFKEVDATLLSQYYNEAREYLSELDEQKDNLKGTVDTASEVLGIKKGIVSKFFKARYEDSLKANDDLTKTLNALDEAVQ